MWTWQTAAIVEAFNLVLSATFGIVIANLTWSWCYHLPGRRLMLVMSIAGILSALVMYGFLELVIGGE